MPTQEPPSGKLADLTKDGTAVASRIADPTHALRICRRFVSDNKERSKRIVKVQGSFDGNAPKNYADLVRAGRKEDSNINFKRLRGLIMEAWAAFFQMVCEVPVSVDGKLDLGDSTQDASLLRGFCEYFHDMMFGWKGFDDTNQLCDLQMLLHGPGLLAWEDPWDWRPKAILATNFYVPNQTNCSLDNCERAMFWTPMTAGDLWRKIENPDHAPGWNIEAVKQAIMDSARTGSTLRNDNWARWQQAFKNGDQYISSEETNTIGAYTLFVQEMDGKISQKIVASKEASTKKVEFLYDSPSRYDGWDQGICVFPYDIGSDGTFHSIKGLGTDGYAFCALLNNIDNSIADLVVSGIKPMWQPTTNSKMEEFKMAKWGGGNFVPNGINPLQIDISRGIVPALEASNRFTQTLSQNTASANPMDLAAPTVEETAKSAMIRAAERAKVSRGLFNRYMRGKDRQYAETWRRAVNPELRSWHPGSKDALKFQEQCKRLCEELGVEWEHTLPAERSPTGKAGKFTVLQCVTNIRANRSLGLGSPALRIEIANEMMDPNFIDRLPEQGQNEVLRMKAGVTTGFHNIDAIIPSLTKHRDPTNDEAVAAQENNAMSILGMEAEVMVVPGQNQVLHLSVHLPSAEKDMAMCQAGEIDPRECQKRLEAKGRHAQEHLAILETNETKQREAKEFSARLAEVASYQDHLDQTIAEQDQAAAKQPQPGEPTPEMVKVQGQLALKAEKEQGTMALKAEKQAFDQALKTQQAQFEQSLKAQEAEFNRRVEALEAVAKTQIQLATKQAAVSEA